MVEQELSKYKNKKLLFIFLFVFTFLNPYLIYQIGNNLSFFPIYESQLELARHLNTIHKTAGETEMQEEQQKIILFLEQTKHYLEEGDYNGLLNLRIAEAQRNLQRTNGGVTTTETRKFLFQEITIRERGLIYIPRLDAVPRTMPMWNYFGKLFSLFNNNIYFLCALWVAIAFSFESRANLKDLTNIAPVSLLKLFFFKWFLNITILSAIVIIAFIISSIFIILVNGIGSRNYPIAINVGINEFAIKDISVIVLENFGFVFLWITAISALGLFISLFVNHLVLQFIFLFSVFFLLGEGNINSYFPTSWQRFLPMNYLNFPAVVSREDYNHLLGIYTENGFLTLSLLTIIFLSLTAICLKIRKKW